ncbi:MAG: GYD domain-containing protein [Chloroflexi bacterium]|nr:GYD domain-containing protein [Chloroflexota bacterium]
MPVFIALGKATDSGMQNLDNLTARHERARRRARDLGGRVIDSYATLGRYDFVVILECPVETCMLILNRESSGGNVRYETMPALPTREFASLFLDEAALREERRVLHVRASRKQGGTQPKTRVRKPAKRSGKTTKRG